MVHPHEAMLGKGIRKIISLMESSGFYYGE
jgi:hypothetical protein